MPNTEAIAAKWVAALAGRFDVPFAARLREHFALARITRLCGCGCNSFVCAVPPGAGLAPLFGEGDRTSCELAFSSDAGDPVCIVVHADERGHFCGMDVFLGMFREAVPDGVTLGDLLSPVP